MRYGYFDDAAREYVIDRVDVPQSMTNYLGTQRMGTVISHAEPAMCEKRIRQLLHGLMQAGYGLHPGGIPPSGILIPLSMS